MEGFITIHFPFNSLPIKLNYYCIYFSRKGLLMASKQIQNKR